MISKQAEAYHDKFRAMGAELSQLPPPAGGTAADIAPQRKAFSEISASFGKPIPHKMEEVKANGVRALWFTPEGSTGKTVVFYTHGGGLMACSADTHSNISMHLAKKLNGRTLTVDYRLAPEQRFPTQIEDCVAAYKWLLDQGHKPENIVFAGDSAGGGLVISTQLLAKQKGLPMPAAAYILSPWLDPEASSDSYIQNAEKDLCVGKDTTIFCWTLILGDQKIDHSNPLMFPLKNSLKGLAPAYIQVGGDENLKDESIALAENLKRNGVEAEVDVVPHMQHVFQTDIGNMPEAEEGVNRGVAFLKRHLK